MKNVIMARLPPVLSERRNKRVRTCSECGEKFETTDARQMTDTATCRKRRARRLRSFRNRNNERAKTRAALSTPEKHVT